MRGEGSQAAAGPGWAVGRGCLASVVLVAMVAVGGGCDPIAPAEDDAAHDAHHGHDHAHDDGHHHTAPHGGALVEIGDHFAHLECVLDPEEGRVTLYVLDGEAEHGRRVAHESLQLTLTQIDGEPADLVLTLTGVESLLTGEAAGDTSQFEAIDERLVGVEQFVARLAEIRIRGQHLEAIEIRYPEGNE